MNREFTMKVIYDAIELYWMDVQKIGQPSFLKP